MNFLQIFISLFAIINPILPVPFFLDLTHNLTRVERNKLAYLAGFTVFIILGICLVAGKWVLKLLGIHPYSLQLGGGLLVLIVAILMIVRPSEEQKNNLIREHNRLQSAHPDKDFDSVKMRIISPLSIPLLIGPGTMVLAILYGQEAKSFSDYSGVLLVMFLLSLVIVVILRASTVVRSILGQLGMLIVSKTMAILLTAVACEMIIEGLRSIIIIH